MGGLEDRTKDIAFRAGALRRSNLPGVLDEGFGGSSSPSRGRECRSASHSSIPAINRGTPAFSEVSLSEPPQAAFLMHGGGQCVRGGRGL